MPEVPGMRSTTSGMSSALRAPDPDEVIDRIIGASSRRNLPELRALLDQKLRWRRRTVLQVCETAMERLEEGWAGGDCRAPRVRPNTVGEGS